MSTATSAPASRDRGGHTACVPLRPLSPFVGRATELEQLASLVDDAHRGQPRLALVVGEPGVGKSRLVAEALNRRPDGPDDDLMVLSGGCHPVSGSSLPYAPVVAALRDVLHRPPARRPQGGVDALHQWPALSVLTPGADPVHATMDVPAGSGRLVLFESVLALVRSLTATRPVALVLEDLHWADQSTADLVSYLARNVVHEHLLVLVTTRPDAFAGRHPLRSTFTELQRFPLTVRVDVPPLGRADLAALVPALTSAAPSDHDLDVLLQRSGGLPFFVEELVSLPAATSAQGDSLPPSIAAGIAAELDALGEVRQLLELMAAAGREVSLELLAASENQPDESLEARLAPALANGVLTAGGDPDSIRFRHDLYREVVLSDLLPGRRRRLHRRLAEVLTARPSLAAGGRPNAELAYHWELSGRPLSAFDATLRAAEDARAGSAVGDVATHLERALDLWEEVDDPESASGSSRGDVARELAECRWLLGDSADAARWAGVAMADIDPDREPTGFCDAAARRGRYLFGAQQTSEALSVLEDAATVASSRTDVPSTTRAVTLATLASVQMLSGDCLGGLATSVQAAARASEAGLPAVLAHARTTLASARTAMGDVAAGAAGFDAVLEDAGLRDGAATGADLADEVTSPAAAWLRGTSNYAFALNVNGWHGRAVEVADQGLAQLEGRPPGSTFRALLQGQRALALVMLGETDRAREAVSDLPRLPPSHFRVSAPHVALAVLLGDVPTATTHLTLTGDDRDLLSLMPAMAVELALLRGEPEEARRLAEGFVARMRFHSLAMFGTRICALGVRAACEVMEGARADGAADRVAAALDEGRRFASAARAFADRYTPGGEAAPPEARCWLALAEADSTAAFGPGQDAEAVAAWQDARTAAVEGGLRVLELRARVGLARALLAAGERATAGAELAAAKGLAQRLEAHRAIDAADAIARRARLDIGGGGPSGRHGATFGLTPREVEVLRAVATGMTNQEIASELFISRKTASVHVSNILSKLDVPNRRAAAVRAKELGILGER